VGSNGTFTMTGGTIKDNESGNDGGGVYIYGPNSKASILNGVIGGSSLADGNKAKYGAGVYVGANGSLELGTDGADYLYPYIQYNESSGSSPSTGGGIVINGSGAAAAFYHGTVKGNEVASPATVPPDGLGGGVLIVNGKLDMRGGTVKNNIADIGPGITVENDGNFFMSKAARALDDPVHLYGTSPSRWITIGNGGFDYTGNIAIVTTEGPYTSGIEILKMGSGGSVAAYCDYFDVDNKGFGFSIDDDGKIKP
jgi:hypothetical protein